MNLQANRHLVRRVGVPAGLFVVGAGAAVLLAGPASAAPTPTASPSSTSTVSPTPAPPSALPTSSAPGSIQVPAGNAQAHDSDTHWQEIGLLGGGLLLLGGGGLIVARRR